jgi:hypothetical protein
MSDITEPGSYFVANYPPFSRWTEAAVPEVIAAVHAGPRAEETAVPLGLYLHIPFCRKRCKFCYFRVYTDVAADDVERYSQALVREAELAAGQRAVAAAMGDVCARRGCDLILYLGDNFYPTGVTSTTDAQWTTKFEDVYVAPSLAVPFWPVLGNHDYGLVYDASRAQAQVDYSASSSRWSRREAFSSSAQAAVFSAKN